MTCIDLQQHVSRLFPDFPVWIAGGAVRDELMQRKQKDFDVFIGGAVKPDTAVVLAAFADYAAIPLSELHASEPFMVGQWWIDGHVVQVMAREEILTADALLDTFDWNVSLFAIGSDGVVVKRCETTAIVVGADLVLQQTKHPLSTLRRGFRFSERFGMRLPLATVKDLCRRISKPEQPELAHD